MNQNSRNGCVWALSCSLGGGINLDENYHFHRQLIVLCFYLFNQPSTSV